VSAQTENYDFIAWPSSGSFPADTDAFTRLSPWSVSFSKSAVRRPAAGDGLTVRIEHDGTVVDELVYGTDPGSPEGIYTPTRYITVNSQFTNDHCIIFRPDLTGAERLEGEYVITIENLFTASLNAPLTVRYRVVFFDLCETEEPEPAPMLIPGDVDGDGGVTMLDALMIIRSSMNLIELDETAAACGDADGNGVVDMQDSLLILRRAMGIITSFGNEG
jgi:hypothetical protein